MAKRLRKLALNEISLVPSGANRGARIVLFKAAMPCDQCPDPEACRAAGTCKEKAMPDQTAEMKKQIDDAVAAALKKAADEQVAAVAKAAKDAEAKAKADGEARIAKIKADADAAIKAAVDALPADAKKAQEEAETLRKANVQAASDLKKAQDTANDALARVAKMETDQKRAATVAKIKSDYPDLAIADVGAVADAFSKLGEPERKALEATLSAANAAAHAASALFRATGVSGATDANSAVGKLEAKAEAIRKADPKLTREQALDQAVTENPDLYKQHLDEKRTSN